MSGAAAASSLREKLNPMSTAPHHELLLPAAQDGVASRRGGGSSHHSGDDEEEDLIFRAPNKEGLQLRVLGGHHDASTTDDADYLVSNGDGDGDGGDGTVADDAPPATASRLSLTLLAAGWIGLAAIVIAWGIVLLPSQVRATVGDDDAGVGLGVIVVVGSVATLLCTPFIGQLSDRSESRFGRRRPFLVIGALAVFVLQLFLGLANPHKPPDKQPLDRNCTDGHDPSRSFETHGSLPLLAFVYALATLAYQFVGTPYNGLIADRTPKSMRGFGSGVMGVMSVIGNLIGASVGILYSGLSVMSIYVILGFLLLITIAVVVFSQTERRFHATKKLPPLTCTHVAKEYAAPFKDHDFLWVFMTRFLMQQGVATVMFFLQYYFHDQVPLPGNMRPEEAVSYALLPLMGCAAISSVVAGQLSDRLGGRRRIFVEISSFVMALAAIAMVFTRTFTGCLLVAVVFGLGFGTYTSCDFAMILDVLPNEADRAKDLAVWHQALVLPQLIATPIGGAIRDGVSRTFCDHSQSPNHCTDAHCNKAYIALFSVAAAYFLISGLLVRLIRNIK